MRQTSVRPSDASTPVGSSETSSSAVQMTGALRQCASFEEQTRYWPLFSFTRTNPIMITIGKIWSLISHTIGSSEDEAAELKKGAPTYAGPKG